MQTPFDSQIETLSADLERVQSQMEAVAQQFIPVSVEPVVGPKSLWDISRGANMKTPISPHVFGRTGKGPDIRDCSTIFEYEVRGLPPGERAFIANFGGRNGARWRVLRATSEVQGQWTGNHETAEEALAALQNGA